MNFLLTPYLAALALFAAESFGRLTRERLPQWIRSQWSLALVLAVSYVLQLIVLYTAATSTVRYHTIERQGVWMPLPVIFPNFPHAGELCASFLLLGALQSATLVTLYRLPCSRALLWWGCSLNLAISLAAPVLGSFDLYGYVHDAILGRASYAPPNVPFSGDYRIFDLWFGRPMVTLYGPLWIPIVQLVTGAAPTLAAKMAAYRVFSAVLFVTLLGLLARAGQPRRMLVAVGLNPALAFLTVANGHNDLLVIVVLTVAAALVQASSCDVPSSTRLRPYPSIRVRIDEAHSRLRRKTVCAPGNIR